MCLSSAFGRRLTSIDAKSLLDEASRLQAAGRIDDCHHVAHGIGEALFELTGEIDSAFSACSPACGSGCFHGVLQAYVPAFVPGAGAALGIPEECRRLSVLDGEEEAVEKYEDCIHGFGHGLFQKADGETPSAVTVCRALPIPDDRLNCLGGVFMEKAHPLTMQDADKLRPMLARVCDREATGDDEVLLHICLIAVGEAIAFATSHDLSRSLSLCDALSPEHRQDCRAGVEEEVAGNREDTENLEGRATGRRRP